MFNALRGRFEGARVQSLSTLTSWIPRTLPEPELTGGLSDELHDH